MAKAKTQTIKLDGAGGTLRAGVNGKFFTVPIGQNFEAEQELVDSLRTSGVSFEEIDGGAASQEGSGEVAPEDTPPAMMPQAVDSNYASGTGTQPGNVTEGSDQSDGEGGNRTIAERAELSDAQVSNELETVGQDPEVTGGPVKATGGDDGNKKGGSRKRKSS